MTYSRILGTGSYLPKKIVTNQDLEKIVDTSDEWIVKRTGIRARHIADDHDSTGSMGYEAAINALSAAECVPADIDMIIMATCTPDDIFPGTACHVQNHLGVANIPAFDLNAVCAGFNYALSVADHFIRQGTCNKILVIGSEVFSRLLDWKDRSTCVLFGDGAGAVVLGASDEPGIISTHLHAAGEHRDALYAPSAVSACQYEGAETPYVKMQGSEVFKFAVTALGQVVEETLAANHLEKSDIDWLIPHQANLRIIKGMAQKLDLSMDRVVVTLDQHGNTSAASIPLALDYGIRHDMIKRDELLLLESFGGGYTWGSALIKY